MMTNNEVIMTDMLFVCSVFFIPFDWENLLPVLGISHEYLVRNPGLQKRKRQNQVEV